LDTLLRRGLATLNLDSEPQLRQQLQAYLALLQRWNRAYNLTAVRDPEQMIVRHLFDSLALVDIFKTYPGSCLDVGTGAGLPGIPLALALPQRNFCLLDSNGKKTRFLFQVKTELGLANMTIRNDRVETFRAEGEFDIIVSRAFASLADMVAHCRHLLARQGRFMAMKGVYPEVEIAQLPAGIELVAVHELQVPGLAEQRHLVELKFANNVETEG